MRPRSLLSHTAVLALLVATPALAEPPTLERVVLSTGGVGFFSYGADVETDGRLGITLPIEQIDDVLRSLTLFDAQGAVQGISLPGATPLADLFRDAPFAETDLDSLPQLLLALRGATIEATGPKKLEGRVVSVVREEVERQPPRHRVTVFGDDGLRTFVLEDADAINLKDDDVEIRLQRVLSDMADLRRAQERRLEIQLAPGAVRHVGFGYLAEVPLWKATYRLALDGDEGLLQGWAVIENMSGRDWDGVQVDLVTGAPLALRQNLYRAYYVNRTDVPVAGTAGGEERAFAADSANLAAAAPAPAMEAMKGMAPRQAGLATGESEEAGPQAIYHLAQPVSVNAGHTLLAPLVDRRQKLTRLALFRDSGGERHPRAAVRLKNESKAALPGGLVTVFERTASGAPTYAGDVQLPPLEPGAEEMLGYALDRKLTVERQEESTGRIETATVVDGVLEIKEREVTTLTFTARSIDPSAGRRLVIEEPERPGWTVAAPADAVTRNGAIRVERDLAPGAEQQVEIVLELPRSRTVALTGPEGEQVLLDLAGAHPTKALNAAITRLQALSRSVAEAEADLGRAETARGETVGEQERLRANLESVPADSDLARRYLAELSASEDRLQAQAKDLSAARDDLRKAQEARADFIRTLKL
ncbi:MAG: hypothetical protein U1E45_03575 [Geminicoccaceae bacterium]